MPTATAGTSRPTAGHRAALNALCPIYVSCFERETASGAKGGIKISLARRDGPSSTNRCPAGTLFSADTQTANLLSGADEEELAHAPLPWVLH